MLATTFGVGLIVAQSVLGWQGMEAGPSVRCGGCGLENSVVTAQLVRLQTSGRWRERERAAHELRRVNWRNHPEVLGALSYSLLNDRNREVRGEAAESLTKMGANTVVVQEAMGRSATRDPDIATRFKARRGLRHLARHHDGECLTCETVPARVVGPTVVVPGEVISGSELTPIREESAGPPPEPTPLPGPSIDSRVDSAPAPAVEPAPKSELGPLPDPDPVPVEEAKPVGETRLRMDRSSKRVILRPAARSGELRPGF